MKRPPHYISYLPVKVQSKSNQPFQILAGTSIQVDRYVIYNVTKNEYSCTMFETKSNDEPYINMLKNEYGLMFDVIDVREFSFFIFRRNVIFMLFFPVLRLHGID